MAVAEAAPLVDRITEEGSRRRVRDIDVGRLVLTALAMVLYAPVWLLGRGVAVVVVAVGWALMSIRLGWRDGFALRSRRRPSG